MVEGPESVAASAKLKEYATHWRTAWQRAPQQLRDRIPTATALGVTILAGPDNSGSLAEEVRLLSDYGLSTEHALAAATTHARRFLGVPGIAEGAPADIVTYRTDPRLDLGALAQPQAILLNGQRVAVSSSAAA